MKTLTLILIPLLSTAATMDIPLTAKSWQTLSYDGIKSNSVKFDDSAIMIGVDSSASPLLHPFDPAQKILGIKIKAKFSGKLKLKTQKQGSNGNDDFLLRVGFVLLGTRTLNFFDRLFAAKWLVKLYRLIPEDSGVSQVSFFNVYSDKNLAGQKRLHPKNDLIEEQFLFAKPKDGLFEQNISLPENSSKTLALWISSDGDDTGSSFKVKIEQLQIITP